MNRIITIVTLLLATGMARISYAQKATDSKSLLWKITGKHLKKPSYLFGTIHIICPDDYVWTERMKQALKSSDKICMEMDMDDPKVIMQATAGMMDTTGRKLSSYFTDEQYKNLKAYVKEKTGMDAALFEPMKPMALQTVLAMAATRCSNAVSYEQKIMTTAQKDKKEITGLEAPDEQLAALASIPTDSVISEMMEAINNKDREDTEYNHLVAAYKTQDLPELYKLLTSSKDLQAGMAALLDDRNKRWIARMTKQMKGNSVFFAVGAGHLWGGNGVINLLKQKGYEVSPVK